MLDLAAGPLDAAEFAQLEQLDDLFENASVGFALSDAQGRVIRGNRALRLLVGGAPPADLAGATADGALIARLIARLDAAEPVTDEPAALRTADGGLREVLIDATAHTGADGRPDRIRWLVRPRLTGATPSVDELDGADNDAVRWARELGPDSDVPPDLAGLPDAELRERLELLEDFFQHVPAAIHLIGLRGIVLRANRLDLAVAGHAEDPGRYLGHHVKPYYDDQTVLEDLFGRWDLGRPIVNFRSRLVGASGGKLAVVIFSNSRVVDGRFRNTRCVVFPDPDQSAPPTPTRRFRWPSSAV
jgi:PAS domain-containing protein